MNLKHVLGISVFTLVLGFGFMACSDDDDDSNTPQVPTEIVGTWKYSSTGADITAKDDETKAAVEEYIKKLPNKGVDTYSLKVDKTYEVRVVGADKDSTGTYVYDNGKIAFDNKNIDAVSYKNDTISHIEDVKAEVIKELELAEGDVTKADALIFYKKITK